MSSYCLAVRKGGLGNQLFQITAGLIVSWKTGRQLLIPEEDCNTHNDGKLLYENTIFDELGVYINSSGTDSFLKYLIEKKDFRRYPGEPVFEEWSLEPAMKEGNLILAGYFQNYRMIEPYEEKVRKIYLDRLQKIVPIVFDGDTKRVGLHIRRGDYLVFSKIHYNLGRDYYETAMSKFPKETMFLVFSDDIEWCMEQEWLFPKEGGSKNILVNEKNELRTLAMMASCCGGFICANSTFSWWGAFLGSHAAGSQVVVPSRWIAGCSVAESGLFPSSWLVIS